MFQIRAVRIVIGSKCAQFITQSIHQRGADGFSVRRSHATIMAPPAREHLIAATLCYFSP